MDLIRTQLSRRKLLVGIAAGATLTTLPEFIFDKTFAANQPSYNLTATEITNAYGRAGAFGFAYNDKSPGPALRMRSGDTLQIKIKNQLTIPSSIHTHGLKTSPLGTGDNPFVAVNPGSTYQYKFATAANHPSSMFWYHPHVHPTVTSQLNLGLMGTLIVEDEYDDQPLIKNSNEQILVFHDPRIGQKKDSYPRYGGDLMTGRLGQDMLVNGQLNPTINANKSLLRLRLLNASVSQYIKIEIPAPLSYAIIAVDASRLDAPVIGQGPIFMPNGVRFEVLVWGPKGKHEIKNYGKTVANLVLSQDIKLAATELNKIKYKKFLKQPSSASVTRKISIDIKVPMMGSKPKKIKGYDTLKPLNEPMVSPAFARTKVGDHVMGDYGFNGKFFDPTRVDIAPKLGSVEDWVITNNTPHLHPFHLHTWPFNIIDRGDGKPLIGWRDTVHISPWATVKIRIPFTEISGKTVYHCHVLDHEDTGLMGIVEVS